MSAEIEVIGAVNGREIYQWTNKAGRSCLAALHVGTGSGPIDCDTDDTFSYGFVTVGFDSAAPDAPHATTVFGSAPSRAGEIKAVGRGTSTRLELMTLPNDASGKKYFVASVPSPNGITLEARDRDGRKIDPTVEK